MPGSTLWHHDREQQKEKTQNTTRKDGQATTDGSGKAVEVTNGKR